MSNNGLTIGSYQDLEDFSFVFKTPNSSGNYTGTPLITAQPRPSDDNVTYEANIIFIIDRPFENNPTAIESFLGSLAGSFEREETPVVIDEDLDGEAVQDAEVLYPQMNDSRTCFFFPLTDNDDDETYNLEYGSGTQEYELTIPSFYDDDSNQFSQTVVTFETNQGDVPAKMDSTPTVGTVDSDSIDISWSAPSGSPAPHHYDVYISDDPYWEFIKHNTSDITSISYTIDNLQLNKTYYIRVVPVNQYDERAGFSAAASATTN